MRVVHVNAYDGNGGAGRAMMRLHHALRQAGVHSEVLCLYQFRSGSDVTPVYRTWLGKLRSIACIFGERYLGKLLGARRGIPFSMQRIGVPVHRHRLVREADIVHLHWVNHGMLAPRQLKKLFKLNKTFVWTLHDSNPLTGGCHVRYDCRNYENNCGNCPALNKPHETDWSRQTWHKKAEAYREAPIHWVAPSRWMGESALRAGLTRRAEMASRPMRGAGVTPARDADPGSGRALNNSVDVIGNALDTTVFYPRNSHKCRAQQGVPQHAFVLLAGHMPSSTDRHKGRKELKEAIRRFSSLSGVDHSRVVLVFFGGAGAGDDGGSWPYPCHFAGTISSEDLLAEYYSMADAFLFPSLQESMGYTALESLACGTPVVGFNTSGVTDVVLHMQNGYLAPTGDSAGFAEGIKWIYDHPDRNALASNGIAHAGEHFGSAVVARKHVRLYTDLLRNGS